MDELSTDNPRTSSYRAGPFAVRAGRRRAEPPTVVGSSPDCHAAEPLTGSDGGRNQAGSVPRPPIRGAPTHLLEVPSCDAPGRLMTDAPGRLRTDVPGRQMTVAGTDAPVPSTRGGAPVL